MTDKQSVIRSVYCSYANSKEANWWVHYWS